MKTPSSVAVAMPPNTAVPRPRRDAAPAPLAMTSGSTPSRKANEVIRIGLNRQAAPLLRPRPTIDAPCFRRSSANSTIRMAFFAERPISVMNANLGIQVVGVRAHRDRDQGAEDPQRHGENHGERGAPALVERGEEQHDENRREGRRMKRLRALAALLLELRPGPLEAENRAAALTRDLGDRRGPPAPSCSRARWRR